MKGDFTRSTFDPKKHYSGVRQQQGRVQLDSDWNEQLDIEAYLRETSLTDVIGDCGAPYDPATSGFKVDLADNGEDLSLSKGRLYVDGILCELDADATFTTQFDSQDPALAAGFKAPNPAYPLLPAAEGTYFVYLDVWQRHVTALEDPHIRETALGGPDTATRTQTFWQVKLFPAPPGSSCLSPAPGDVAAPTGKLKAQTRKPQPSDTPCTVPSSAGYTRLENQLYRVEIHTGGAAGTATFKWSRENGSVVAEWLEPDDANQKRLRVRGARRDEVLGFAKGQWVELTDDTREVTGTRGVLVKLDDVEGDLLTLTANGPTWTGFPVHPKVRRWDHTNLDGADNAIKVPTSAATWVDLEGDVQVAFEPGPGGTFRTGDYWLIPARAFIGEPSGNIEWPKDSSGPMALPPHGIKHHYCKLAVVEVKGGKLHFVEDCRQKFLPLTKLKTQEAEAAPACCAFPVSPDGDWERSLQRFLEKKKKSAMRPDVSLCFAPGTYLLTRTLELTGMGNVKIEGTGAGTRILALSQECALRLSDCLSVIVRDLSAQSGVARSGKKTSERHLNGTLTFERCGPVTISGATLQCAGGDQRAASCITVLGTSASKAKDAQTGGVPVRIRSSDLKVGRGQVGILVVDGQRIQIEDNNIAVVVPRLRPRYDALIQGRTFRSQERRQLLSAFQVDQKKVDTSSDTIHLSMKGHRVQLKTAKPLRKVWSALLEERPLAESATVNDVRNHFYNLADEILRGGPASHHHELQDYLAQLRQNVRPVASQGIVIGGRQAGDVRIVDNSVTGVMQGVHLGLSYKGEHWAAGRVRLSGNRIVVVLATGAGPGAHGIFLGSMDSAIVDGNHVQVVGRASTPLSIDGIRVCGRLGALLLVKHNHLVGCTTGVRVQPVKVSEVSLWRVTENVLVGGGETVVAKNVEQSDNHP